MVGWRNGRMVMEWWNGGMVEWQNGGMAEWQNGGMDGGIAGNGGMVESRNGGMAEWRNGRMATYLLHLWYTPTTPTPFNLL
jgi:hypothetical protein